MIFTKTAGDIKSAIVKLLSGDNAALSINVDKEGNDIGFALLGGSNGGTFIISNSSADMEEFDFIIVGTGVVFTELKDSEGVDVLELKKLTGITFNESITLKSGTGNKIRNMLYSGGNVFGYNY